jgi:DNA helicase-2/ATP-dependent DNA helicase PcrA
MALKDADNVFDSLMINGMANNIKLNVGTFKSLQAHVVTINNLSKSFDAYSCYQKTIELFDIVSIYKDKDRITKVSDLEQLRKSINRWKIKQEYYGLSTTLKSYLRYVKLIDIQESQTESADAIKIMTVHGSKGLEFYRVFIPSVNENDFPSRQSANQEEERRLMYVAMTRAKSELYISSTSEKISFSGMTQKAGPSIFINEIFN